MIEFVSEKDYVKNKLTSNHFKVGSIMKTTGLSRYQIKCATLGQDVKPYVLLALADYFRRIGE